MFMNLDTLPVGQHMYTVGITLDPVDMPDGERYIEEIDVVCSSRATVAMVVNAVLPSIELYSPAARVVGVIDQSDGYVLAQNWEGVV